MTKGLFPDAATSTLSGMTLTATIQVLEQIEQLPGGSSGTLAFGDEGVVWIEGKRVCWAIARDMGKRLTDLLCEQSSPPIPRATMEELLKRCKRERRKLGETLVSSALISEAQLRKALESHNCEAITHLARACSGEAARFSPHHERSYDPRFAFTTAELFAALTTRRRRELARLAAGHLGEFLGSDATGFAFLRDARFAHPLIVAVDPACSLHVAELLELGSWATRAFDVVGFFDDQAQLISGQWCSRTSAVAWRGRELTYVALCSRRSASALLVSELERRLVQNGRDAAGEGAVP